MSKVRGSFIESPLVRRWSLALILALCTLLYWLFCSLTFSGRLVSLCHSQRPSKFQMLIGALGSRAFGFLSLSHTHVRRDWRITNVFSFSAMFSLQLYIVPFQMPDAWISTRFKAQRRYCDIRIRMGKVFIIRFLFAGISIWNWWIYSNWQTLYKVKRWHFLLLPQ